MIRFAIALHERATPLAKEGCKCAMQMLTHRWR